MCDDHGSLAFLASAQHDAIGQDMQQVLVGYQDGFAVREMIVTQ